jgi:glycosyltransferase involved in cell wall biosynthesis
VSDNFWALVIAVINIGLWSILYVYIYYNLLLIWLEWHTRNKTTPPPPAPEEWPGVTVQLPMYNEAEVCEALLAAVVALDYPRDKLHIQVLDDSTDRTSALVAARVAEYQRQGVSVSHLQRVDRVGYKAGALAEGLLETDDPFLLLLDADFLPNPTLLREVLPHFADPKVGMVQARWGHIRPPATPGGSGVDQLLTMRVDGPPTPWRKTSTSAYVLGKRVGASSTHTTRSSRLYCPPMSELSRSSRAGGRRARSRSPASTSRPCGARPKENVTSRLSRYK